MLHSRSPPLTITQDKKRLVPGPLSGKRLLITRPEGQSAVTAGFLRRHGAEPIVMPLITLAPPPDPAGVAEAVRNLEDYDLVAFTSVNAVAYFLAEIEAQGRDAGNFGSARIAAIGAGTATALARRGVHVHIVPRAFVGEALAQAVLDDPAIQELLPHHRPRVLILRALVAREVLPQRLREAGCDVDVVPVYETQPVSASCRNELISRLETHAIDCVMLTSSSAANGLVDLLGSRAVELMQGVVVSSIGPITTATAEHRGLTVHVEAAEHTVIGAISALESHYVMGSAPPIRPLAWLKAP